MKYIAFCTKGLENVVRDEIAEKVAGLIEEVADKRIVFTSEASYTQLCSLRTVDDLALFISRIEHVRSLDDVLAPLSSVDILRYKKIIASSRQLPENTFSLTITAAKSSIPLLKAAPILAEEIVKITHWQYLEKDHTQFDIRLFLDGIILYLAIRLTPESLSKRAYKTISLPGSLKPTVAASMLKILGRTDGKKLIDNFCGSGTILCEAVGEGDQVFGSDINPASLDATKTNLTYLTALHDDRLRLQSATSTSWPDYFFDAAVSNLPWDKQIEVDSITDLYIGTLIEYARILRKNAVLCLLVTKPELLIKHAKNIFPHSTLSSTTIGLLGQNPTIVRIER